MKQLYLYYSSLFETHNVYLDAYRPNVACVKLNAVLKRKGHDIVYLGFKTASITTAAFITEDTVYTPQGNRPFDVERTPKEYKFLIPIVTTFKFNRQQIYDNFLSLFNDVISTNNKGEASPVLKKYTLDSILDFFYNPPIKSMIKKIMSLDYNYGVILFTPRITKELDIFYTLELPSPSGAKVKTFIVNTFPTDNRPNVTVTLGLTKNMSNGWELGPHLFNKGLKAIKQTLLISHGRFKYLVNTKDYIKIKYEESYTVSKQGIDLSGTYGLKESDEDPTKWFFIKIKEKKKPAFITTLAQLHTKHRPRIKFPYKYTLAMKPKMASDYETFKKSMLEKHIHDIYNGVYEIFTGPLYVKSSFNYYQIVMDFDGKGSISSVRSLGKQLENIGLGEFFIVQFTGNGFHIKSMFAVKDLDLKKLKDLPFFAKYKSFDRKGSFKTVPVRAPWSYSKKRQTTNFALSVTEFLNNKITLSYFRQKPSEILSLEEYKKLLNYFIVPQYFLNINTTIPQRFLNLVGYKK